MFGWFKSPTERLVERIAEKINLDAELRLKNNINLIDEITSLKEQIETLRIEKGRKEEEFARREREVSHKLGLERVRQEQDAANHKREIELEIKSGNLKASEERFKDQMEFQRKQLENQISNLQGLVQKVFEKIPEVRHETKVIQRIGDGNTNDNKSDDGEGA